MNTVLESLRKELAEKSDEKTRLSGERFFKEPVQLYGLKSAEVTSIGRQYFSGIKDKSKDHIFRLCEELWQSGMMEETFVACAWSYAVRRQFEASDFLTFERWIGMYVTNWASCDTLCNHTVGDAIIRFPDQISILKRWATFPNRWLKRASAVSLIIPARQGRFADDIFEIADTLLTDKDDMVQKGYGWMLKEASKAYQQNVFDYIMRNKAIMPRTSLRYAIEKMPAELKLAAMSK